MLPIENGGRACLSLPFPCSLWLIDPLSPIPIPCRQSRPSASAFAPLPLPGCSPGPAFLDSGYLFYFQGRAKPITRLPIATHIRQPPDGCLCVFLPSCAVPARPRLQRQDRIPSRECVQKHAVSTGMHSKIILYAASDSLCRYISLFWVNVALARVHPRVAQFCIIQYARNAVPVLKRNGKNGCGMISRSSQLSCLPACFVRLCV